MKRKLLAAALLFAILAAAGCGSDSSNRPLLSSSQAGELRATLSQIEQEVSAGNCSSAGDRVAALETQIDSIRRLDRKLRSALRTSARRLDALVSADCNTSTTTTPTQTTPTTPEQGSTGTTGASTISRSARAPPWSASTTTSPCVSIRRSGLRAVAKATSRKRTLNSASRSRTSGASEG